MIGLRLAQRRGGAQGAVLKVLKALDLHMRIEERRAKAAYATA